MRDDLEAGTVLPEAGTAWCAPHRTSVAPHGLRSGVGALSEGRRGHNHHSNQGHSG